MSRLLFLFALLAVASAFRPMAARRATPSAVKMSVFDKATKDWANTYPQAWAKGWGPTTKAERWNGRHGKRRNLILCFLPSCHYTYFSSFVISHVWLDRSSCHRLRQGPRFNS